MLDRQTNFKCGEEFRLLNTTLLMQSEVIPLVFKQELKMTFALKDPMKPVQRSSICIVHLNENSMIQLGLTRRRRKTLVCYHHHRSFMLLCPVFALDSGLLSASDFPTVEAGSSSTCRSHYEVSS